MFLDRTVDFIRALASGQERSIDAVSDSAPEQASEKKSAISAVKVMSWEDIERAHAQQTTVIGQLKLKTSKGYIVTLGDDLEAFMPYYRFDNYNYPYIPLHMRGVDYEFHVMDIDREKQQAQVSHLSVIKTALRETIRHFKRDDVVKGEITSVSDDYGATVDINGVAALLPLHNISWQPINSPHDVLRVGNIVEVQVMAVKAAKFSLVVGLKQRDMSVWGAFLREHPEGSRLSVTVSRVVDYGYLVNTSSGIKGLVHVSEVSWHEQRPDLRARHRKGDVLTVKLLSVDHERQQLALSMKQLSKDPWGQLFRRYKKGDIAEFTIAKNVGYGLLVDTPFDVMGLVHHTEISWLVRGQSNTSNFDVGERLRLKVLDVDTEKHHFHLSLKQLTANPFVDTDVDNAAVLPMTEPSEHPQLRLLVAGHEGVERDELKKHLRKVQDDYAGQVDFAVDSLSEASLETAHLLIVLVDAAYLDSNVYADLLRQLAACERQPFILPVVVGEIDNWHSYSVLTHAWLPVNAKPAQAWRSRLLCWLSIERGIRNVIQHLCDTSLSHNDQGIREAADYDS